MYAAALIVAHLDYDGYVRVFEMRARPGSPITIARADEFDDPHSGPFHFLDGHYRDTFEKGLAECKAWKLSESNFTLADGVYRFRTSWEGIPTERNSLSCYSLSLPEFAVPIEIRCTDPHSGREYSKSVVRDSQHNRFVTYLECRSSYGTFDFLLEARFRNDRDNFRSARYTDDHVIRRGANIHPYSQLVPKDLQGFVQHFLYPNSGALTPSFGGAPSQLGLIPSVTLISAEQVQIVNGQAPVQNPTEPGKNLPKLPHQPSQDLSEMFDGANLTEKQREVISLRLEYGENFSRIARRLHLSRKTVSEHYEAAARKLREARKSTRKNVED
jgi:DNA-binding CsgD family transcriptional regulator